MGGYDHILSKYDLFLMFVVGEISFIEMKMIELHICLSNYGDNGIQPRRQCKKCFCALAQIEIVLSILSISDDS